jgi:UDP-glucose 4-epimerase
LLPGAACAGYHPVVYDNFSTGHRSFVTGALVTGDLADKRQARARLCRSMTSSR